jgi:hypothetical protein
MVHRTLGGTPSLFVATIIFLVGCGGRSPAPVPAEETGQASETGAWIRAAPNPVPIGVGPGRTTLSWDAGASATAQVYVSIDGKTEQLFAGGVHQGSQDAGWIDTGPTYEFRLYAGSDHQTKLADVKVERQRTPMITASPNPVTVANGVAPTTITWSTGDGSPGQVYVAIDGQAEALFAGGSEGSHEAAWIRPGSVFEFSLYRGPDRTKRLGAVTVTGGPTPPSSGQVPGSPR